MTPSRRKLLLLAASAPVAGLLPQFGWAQGAYPDHNITMICPFAPGTGGDVFARFYANQLQKVIGRTVVVENKVGAGGTIGAAAVAKAKPDGYTIMVVAGSSVLASAPHLYLQVGYDPAKDFQSVTTLAKITFVLTVAADSPYKSLADLTAALKEKGDKASFGSNSNTAVIASELYKEAFGLKTVGVRYRDALSVLNDLLGRQIEFIFMDPGATIELTKAGKIRPLVTASANRIAALPDVPSAREAGMPNMDLIAWWSVHVAAGTPASAVDRLESAFNEIVASKEAKDFIVGQGGDPFPGNRKVLDDILTHDLKAWADYARMAKIEKQ